jgi:hypothetical protein
LGAIGTTNQSPAAASELTVTAPGQTEYAAVQSVNINGKGILNVVGSVRIGGLSK